MQFSNEEIADIIYVYGYCDGNTRAACNEYNLRYPNRRQPYREVFSNAFRRLREFGINERRSGGPHPQHTVAQEIAIIDAVLDDPTTSTRRISTQLQLPHNFVWRTINREVLHPYHYQRVHHLQPGDEVQRLAFCHWLLEQNEQNPNFISDTLWTDESMFTRNGINNSHNEHTWSLQNPHAVRIRGFQQRFSMNTWCGILNGQLLPIQILPNRLNAAAYLAFLENDLQDLLDDIPIGLHNRMWYQHDGAPPHTGRNVVEWLQNNFNGRWIGRRGPVHWPARSPDLNPLDFYLWGHLKQLVYAEPINTIEQLENRILNSVHTIQNTVNFAEVYNSLVLRCQACINVNGGIFENLL